MTDTNANLIISIDSRQATKASADLDGLTAAGTRAERATATLAGETRAAMTGLSGMAGATGLLGAALSGLGLGSVTIALGALNTKALEFSNSLKEISTLVDTATFDMDALTKAAIEQAGAFNSAPITQTKALYQIISAGASSAAQATENLTAANKLAVGGVTSVAVAADGLTSVLNAYGSKVESAAAVSDAMFVAMKGGKTTIAELSANLGTVAPLASAMGVSFDEVAAATAALTKGGVTTSVAITGLRAILAAVAKPSDEAAKLASALGLEFNAAAIEAKGFSGFLKDLATKTGGNTDALALLFGGVEALVPVMALSGQAGADFASIMGQMADKAGQTDAALKKIQSGPGAQIGIIFATLGANALGAAAGLADQLTPALTTVAGLITGTVEPSRGLDIALKAVALTTGVVLTKALYEMVVPGLLASNTMRALAVSVSLVGVAETAAAVATTALSTAIKIALGPIGWAAAAVGLLATAWSFYEDGQQQAERASSNLYSLIDKNKGLIAQQTGATVASASAKLQEAVATRTQIEAELALARARGQNALSALASPGGYGATRQEASDVSNLNEMAIARQNIADAEKAINDNLAEQAKIRKQIAGLQSGEALAADAAAKAAAAAAKAAAAAAAVQDGAAKKTPATDAEKAAKEQLKDSERFLQSLKDETAQLGLSAIARKEWEIASEAAKAPNDALAKSIKEQGAALIVKAQAEAADLEGLNNTLAAIQLETDLIGKSNVERAVRLAQLAEEQRLRREGGQGLVDSDVGKQAISKAGDVAAADEAKRARQEAYNYELTRTSTLLADLDASASSAADAMSSAFNGASRSMGAFAKTIGAALTAYTGLAAREAKIAEQRKKYVDEGQAGTKEYRDFEVKAARDTASARLDAYASMASAAQEFFEQGSDGYKALQVAMIAFRTIETLTTLQAIALKGTDVATTVAAEGTKATASGIAAYAKTLASLPFPYNLAAGAVVLGALASVGVALSGGGSGGSTMTAAERRQQSQGTGSVLGDASAKSDSIAKALDQVAANTNRDLEYSNSMLRALRSIDDSIGSVAAALARSLGASGALGSDALKLGTTASGNFLFGSATTRTLKDQGLSFDTQALGDILSGGLEAAIYQVVQTTKKSSFLGISLGSSTSTRTTQTAIDAALSADITRVIASLKDGVLAAASVLGVEGADATLAAFQVSIGKISLKDMTGAEIEDALSAVFSKVGDDLAGAVVPGLTALQKVGEGLFETLVRVARQYQVVDVTLSSIGKTFGAVGLSSLEARERLVDLFGSLDDFTEQVSFYSENFLTEAERLAPIQASLTKELARLGLTGLDTRDEFKALVQSLDVSTAAGAELFAALMSIAPAFAAVTEETKAVTDARDALSSAYDREKSAIEGTRDSFRDLARSLGDYRASLYSGPTAALSPEAQYLAAKAEFQRIQALAATGNEDALGQLQGVSQEYLDASKAYFASSAGYFQDLEAVRAAVTAAEATATAQVDVAQAQLDALEASVAGLIDLNQSVLTVAQAIDALTVALGGQGLPGLASPTTAPSAPQSPPLPPQGQTTPAAANDNAGVVAELQNTNAQLQALVATQRASLEQQAAISAAQQARLEAIEAELNRQSRAAQA